MSNHKKVRIGCSSAFWGDTATAASQLVEKGKLDYLVCDFLAEVTMSILAGAKMKNPEMGYAGDFIKQIGPLLKEIKEQEIRVISNAGGINLKSCRSSILAEAEKAGLKLNIALVYGDDLTDQEQTLRELKVTELESKNYLPENILSMNAYLGASGIQLALAEGADMVITGRCVDSALVLGPLMHEFGWTVQDYDLLAAGSLAGHIIECGAQCTGGNFTDWHLVEGFDNMGFPIVEVQANGDFIVTKPEGTGGLVTFGSVAEQFLYEIGDPGAYILPDVVCDFTGVTIEEIGPDRVLVHGAIGLSPTDTYKVSATYMDGYRVAATIVIGGKDATEKAELIANAILKKTSRMFKEQGLPEFKDTCVSVLGTDSIYGPQQNTKQSREVVLRLMATHDVKEALILLSREIAQSSTGMTAGVMNYLGGRPSVSPSIRLFSFLLPKKIVTVQLDLNGQSLQVDIPTKGGYNANDTEPATTIQHSIQEPVTEVPLVKLAYARSGDKGDHANIGVIARQAEFFPYIRAGLSPETVAEYFSHVLKGPVQRWDVPGINGLNFLLKNSLGGGGMASLRIDPQGKAYAQQLLEVTIFVPQHIANQVLV